MTPRERDVMGWLKTGLSYKEIAERAGVSEFTVKHQFSAICVKLNCQNKVHAVVVLLEEKHAAELEELRSELAIPVS